MCRWYASPLHVDIADNVHVCCRSTLPTRRSGHSTSASSSSCRDWGSTTSSTRATTPLWRLGPTTRTAGAGKSVCGSTRASDFARCGHCRGIVQRLCWGTSPCYVFCALSVANHVGVSTAVWFVVRVWLAMRWFLLAIHIFAIFSRCVPVLITSRPSRDMVRAVTSAGVLDTRQRPDSTDGTGHHVHRRHQRCRPHALRVPHSRVHGLTTGARLAISAP